MRRLLVDFARVGDLVMVTPILRHLARDGEVELLARAWAAPLLAGQPGLAAVHVLAKPYRGLAGLGRLLFGANHRRIEGALRARGFDELVVFKGEHPAIRAWIESWRGAVPVRTITRKGEGAPRHVVDANLRALESGGFPVADFDPLPRLAVAPAALAAARARLRPLGERVVALQAGSSLTHSWWRKQPNLKGLAAAQWAGLIARLSDARQADAFVLHGSAPEGREAGAIRAALRPDLRARVHDWTGRVPLAELPAVLAASYATISVDTGPAHIAAAVGCPLLVLFGPTDPAVFQPRGAGAVELLLGSAPCQFCHGSRLFKTCRSNVCLNTLSTEVLGAAWDRLQARVAAQIS
jgi:heptosyltransferase-2/heptosyltransferase-3